MTLSTNPSRSSALRVLAAALLFGISAVTASPAAAASEPVRLHVSLPERTLSVIQGDEILRTYDVAIGKDEHPTPTGSFTIRKIVWNPAWVPPPGAKWAKGKTAKQPGDPDNPMKRVKIFFKEPDYYIHGTGDADSIGSAASHGCIRMTPQQAAEVARLVMENGGSPRPEPWYRRILHSRKTTVVYLRNPIVIEVKEATLAGNSLQRRASSD